MSAVAGCIVQFANDSVTIQKRTLDFAGLVEESNAAFEKLYASLIHLTEEQQHITAYVNEVHDIARSLIQ